MGWNSKNLFFESELKRLLMKTSMFSSGVIAQIQHIQKRTVGEQSAYSSFH